MRQLVDIHDILEAESPNDFRDELVRLGSYDPQLCEALLTRVLRSNYYMGTRNPFSKLFERGELHGLQSMLTPLSRGARENPWTRRFSKLLSFFKRRREMEADIEQHTPSVTARSTEPIDPIGQGIHRFVQRCQEQRYGRSEQIDSKLEYAVMQLYAGGAADAIKYLLERADPETRRLFTGSYLDSEALARQATVRVVVREADETVAISGNTGRFLVFLKKEWGREVRLNFTNQASMVYYLRNCN